MRRTFKVSLLLFVILAVSHNATADENDISKRPYSPLKFSTWYPVADQVKAHIEELMGKEFTDQHYKGELTKEILGHILEKLQNESNYEKISDGLELFAKASFTEARKYVLKIAEKYTTERSVNQALRNVALPEDAIIIDGLLQSKGEFKTDISYECLETMGFLSGLNSNIARKLLESPLQVSRTAGILGLMRSRDIDGTELLKYLESAPLEHREAVYKEIKKNPDIWGQVLLERIDDPGADLLSDLKKALDAGGVSKNKVKEKAGELNNAFHAYLRQRAAEMMFYVDPVKGEKWLRREHALYRTWHDWEISICTGEIDGFTGRFKSLIEPETHPRKIWKRNEPVNKEAVKIPDETFKPYIFQVPYQKITTYNLLLLNNTGKEFTRYMEFGETTFVTYGEHRLQEDRKTVRTGHPHYRQTFKPRESVFNTVFTLPSTFNEFEIVYEFLLPDKSNAKYTIKMTPDMFQKKDDLTVFIEGLKSEKLNQRKVMYKLFSDKRYYGGPEGDIGKVPVGDKRRIVTALLEAVQHLDKPGALSWIKFSYFRFGFSNSIRNNDYYFLLRSFSRFLDALKPSDLSSLLSIESYGGISVLGAVIPKEMLVESVINNLNSKDRLVIRNIAFLSGNYIKTKERDFAELIKPSVKKWLSSDDPLIKSAGMYLVYTFSYPDLEKELDKAVQLGLTSHDPDFLAHALYINILESLRPDFSFWKKCGGVNSENVAYALLKGIKKRFNKSSSDLEKNRITDILLTLAENSDGDWSLHRELAGNFRLFTTEGNIQNLAKAWEKTGFRNFAWALLDLKYDFKSPVIALVHKHMKFSPYDDGQLFHLVKMEEERLSRHSAIPINQYYRMKLEDFIYTGNDKTAVACLPLAFYGDTHTVELLEYVKLSDSERARKFASKSLNHCLKKHPK